MKVRRVIRSLIPALGPRGLTDPAELDSIADFVLQFIDALAPPFQRALRMGILSFDQGARVWPRGRGRAAHELPVEDAADYFRTWFRSRVPIQRNLAIAIKGLVCVACYETDEVKARMGYTPDEWIDKVRTQRLKVHKDAIAAQEQAIVAPDPLGDWPLTETPS